MTTYILFNGFKVEISNTDNGGELFELQESSQITKLLKYELKRTAGEIEDINTEISEHLIKQNYEQVAHLNSRLIEQSKAFYTAKWIIERNSNEQESYFSIVNDLKNKVIDAMASNRGVNISLNLLSRISKLLK